MNNLLASGKKYALIAISMFIMGIQKAGAYDERSCMTQQQEIQTVSDKDRKELGGVIALTFLMMAGGFYLFGVREGADFAGKLNWDRKQRHLEQQQRQK